MIHEVELIRTEAVLVRRVEHVPGVRHRDPDRECVGSHGINFVEAGSFRVRTTGRWLRLDERCMFVTAPTMEFSCAHDGDYPVDRCYSIRYADEAVENARALVTLGASPVRPLTNRQAFLQRMLRQCAKGDEARTEALAGALLGSLATHVPRQPLFRPDRLAWYAARIDRAKALIAARHAEPLSLSDMARDVGMSVFHFARIFRELEGEAPHRFLTGVRLAHAYARLREGAGVTETCFAVGFGSLSHFVTSFRRRHGCRPSEVGGSTGSRPRR